MADQSVLQMMPFKATLPVNMFTDAEQDMLTYSAGLASGVLPAWLHFDASTLTFSGTPGKGDHSVTVRVTATDSFGGSAFDDFNLDINVIAGTEPSLYEAVRIYPNPGKGIFKIETSLTDNITDATVMDVTGNVVATNVLQRDGDSCLLALSHLSSGVYVVRLTAGKNIISQKLVVSVE
jgi:hypothetical protein